MHNSTRNEQCLWSKVEGLCTMEACMQMHVLLVPLRLLAVRNAGNIQTKISRGKNAYMRTHLLIAHHIHYTVVEIDRHRE